MKRKISWTDDAEEDYCNLPDEIVDECDRMIDAITNNINFGQKLSNHHGKDLSDCRKVYFNNYKHRIVYRKVDDKDTIEVTGIIKTNVKAAEILGIGEREGEQIYNTVAARLGRFTD